MPAKDLFHQLVRTALEQEGWTITHDPYHIDLGFVDLYIDLGAERLIAAIKDNEKIAIEIKTFLSASTISEFHTAIGQFINYRIALEAEESDRILGSSGFEGISRTNGNRKPIWAMITA